MADSRTLPRTWENSPARCAVDEVREYYCDELLPLESAKPAPEPYANCPGVIDNHFGDIDPSPVVAAFDASYTRHIRLRQPPGHSCCYSWCSEVPLVDGEAIDPQARCAHRLAVRETYCFDEPEQGTSEPARAPFELCPEAIKPPEGVVFYSPVGAHFDPIETATKRQQGFRSCCYAWCSIAPPNTGMHAH